MKSEKERILPQQEWQRLQTSGPFDLIVVGGGITGAGVFREATRAGLKTLLVEQQDFAWGTSSRSTKLVHGGLRYLKQGNFRLTRESVLERERLLAQGSHLVKRLLFMSPIMRGQKPGRFVLKSAMAIYNLMAGQWSQISYSALETHRMAPHLRREGILGSLCFQDAQCDDARLVLRLVFEAQASGGLALNRVSASRPERLGKFWSLDCTHQGNQATVQASAVVNASGAWVNRLLPRSDPRLRLLRGSHLVFPADRLPAQQALFLLHPRDGRPVFLLPWEGASLFGTTDVDHGSNLDKEACISASESSYLMEALQELFPSLSLTCEDVLASFAGVRSVLSSGHSDPSKESRDHKVWDDQGLLSVTGGKLTTFRVMAKQLLKLARPYLRSFSIRTQDPCFDVEPCDWSGHESLALSIRNRLFGRYGGMAVSVARSVPADELVFVAGSETLWAEIRWAARHEMVRSLDDLLLRRVRLGLLLPQGGSAILGRVREICAQELGWGQERWAREVVAYKQLIASCYSLPE